MIFDLLKPGIKVKRYILLLICSVLLCSYSIIFLNNNRDIGIMLLMLYVLLISISIFLMIISFVLAQKNLLNIVIKYTGGKNIDVGISNILVSEKKLNDGPKIVVIGGGSGLSNMLKGLKYYSNNITAIVTMFDDGGSTGKLRKEIDILPPGDIRRCIVALSSAEDEMENLMAYRFTEGTLKGHSFGNLFIAAMTESLGSFPKAISMMSNVLVVKGKVLPVTLDKTPVLCAELENGSIVKGEDKIKYKTKEEKSSVKKMFLSKACEPAEGVIEAIEKADVIVMGPGSIYTSIIPDLLVSGVSGAIIDSKAIKIYVCNIMNQIGETDTLTMSEYINQLEEYIGKNVIDYCLVNTEEISEDIKSKCEQVYSIQVPVDIEKVNNKNIKFIFDKFVNVDYEEKKILHNTKKLSYKIYNIWKEYIKEKQNKK